MVAMMSTKFGVMLYTRDHTVAEVGEVQERGKVFYSTLGGNSSKAFKLLNLVRLLFHTKMRKYCIFAAIS